MATLERLVAGDTPAVIEALGRDGAVIVEELLDPSQVERLGDDLAPALAAADSGAHRRFVNDMIAAFFGTHTRHVTGVAGRSAAFRDDVLVNPTLLEVADAVLLPGCADYLLNIAHLLDRGPGAEQQYPHRDEDVWIDVPRPHPELQLATLIAIDPFTAENGATVVAPGSHRWERDRQPSPTELVPAVMPAGSAVIYLGSTIHAGGANTTASQRRRGMHVSYCAGWLRTEENHFLTTPLEIVRTLDERQQRLLGFGAHDAISRGGGYLGTVDLQDPTTLLADGTL